MRHIKTQIRKSHLERRHDLLPCARDGTTHEGGNESTLGIYLAASISVPFIDILISSVRATTFMAREQTISDPYRVTVLIYKPPKALELRRRAARAGTDTDTGRRTTTTTYWYVRLMVFNLSS